jgi:hypothetical protein
VKEGLVLGFVVGSKTRYLQNILKLFAVWGYEEDANAYTS